MAKHKEYHDRYVLGEGYPQLFSDTYSETPDAIRLETKAGYCVTLNQYSELYQINCPKYRLVLEKVKR